MKDIKSEVKKLVACAKFQQLAETRGYFREFAYYGKFVQQSLDDIDAWADMAEAAIALAEFTSHWWFLHKPLPNWDERFDELVKAFEKAKETCNSPAGEGET